MDFTKVVHIGETTGHYKNRTAQVFCEIELKAGRLSICGVEGPTRDGNAIGGCGQILDAVREITSFAPGWTAALRDHFVLMWDLWHLNDMRAGCEHQRASWDLTKRCTLVTYRLTKEGLREKNNVERKTLEQAERSGAVQLSIIEREALKRPWEIKLPAEAPEPGIYYQEKGRETKLAIWVRPEEHPDGLLCKPCEVCGYRYGSAWLREDVPQSVIEWLQGLPETDLKPAWV